MNASLAFITHAHERFLREHRETRDPERREFLLDLVREAVRLEEALHAPPPPPPLELREEHGVVCVAVHGRWRDANCEAKAVRLVIEVLSRGHAQIQPHYRTATAARKAATRFADWLLHKADALELSQQVRAISFSEKHLVARRAD